MDQYDQAYYEKMITLTGYPEFHDWTEEIKKEIYQLQANVLQSSKSWEQVCFAKGYAAGLSAVINLRSTTLATKKNAEEQDVLDALEDTGDANV
jgi:hypothetical protein